MTMNFRLRKKLDTGKQNKLRRAVAAMTTVMMGAGLVVSSYANSAAAQDAAPVCGLEEHVHTEACYSYQGPAQLICREVDPYLQNVHVHIMCF